MYEIMSTVSLCYEVKSQRVLLWLLYIDQLPIHEWYEKNIDMTCYVWEGLFRLSDLPKPHCCSWELWDAQPLQMVGTHIVSRSWLFMKQCNEIEGKQLPKCFMSEA